MVLNYTLLQAERMLLTHTITVSEDPFLATVGLSFFYFVVYIELYLQSRAVRYRVSLHRSWKESVQVM